MLKSYSWILLCFCTLCLLCGGGLQGSRAGCAVGRARDASVAEAGSGGGVQPSTVTASLNADFIPDDEAPALMISLELALAAQALVHDKAQAPSSAPPQPGPLRGGPDSGAGTAQ